MNEEIPFLPPSSLERVKRSIRALNWDPLVSGSGCIYKQKKASYPSLSRREQVLAICGFFYSVWLFGYLGQWANSKLGVLARFRNVSLLSWSPKVFFLKKVVKFCMQGEIVAVVVCIYVEFNRNEIFAVAGISKTMLITGAFSSKQLSNNVQVAARAASARSLFPSQAPVFAFASGSATCNSAPYPKDQVHKRIDKVCLHQT